MTIEAYTERGLVRTFNAWDLALAYRDQMQALGATIYLRRVVQQRRAA